MEKKLTRWHNKYKHNWRADSYDAKFNWSGVAWFEENIKMPGIVYRQTYIHESTHFRMKVS